MPFSDSFAVWEKKSKFSRDTSQNTPKCSIGSIWAPRSIRHDKCQSSVAFQTQNGKLRRFSYAISQIAPLPPMVGLNCNSRSLIATRYAVSWHLPFSAPKSQHFKSQRLQDANASKSQTLAFYTSQRFSARKVKSRPTKPFSGPKKKHFRVKTPV